MWRGLILTKAVEQFLTDVRWGDMDYLLVDMPPGTGDIQMGLARMLPAGRDARGHHAGARGAEGRVARRRHGAPLVPEGGRRRREHERVRRARRRALRPLRGRRRRGAREGHRRPARRADPARARGLRRRRRRSARRARATPRARPAPRSTRSQRRSSTSCSHPSRWPAAPRASLISRPIWPRADRSASARRRLVG